MYGMFVDSSSPPEKWQQCDLSGTAKNCSLCLCTTGGTRSKLAAAIDGYRKTSKGNVPSSCRYDI